MTMTTWINSRVRSGAEREAAYLSTIYDEVWVVAKEPSVDFFTAFSLKYFLLKRRLHADREWPKVDLYSVWYQGKKADSKVSRWPYGEDLRGSQRRHGSLKARRAKHPRLGLGEATALWQRASRRDTARTVWTVTWRVGELAGTSAKTFEDKGEARRFMRKILARKTVHSVKLKPWREVAPWRWSQTEQQRRRRQRKY